MTVPLERWEVVSELAVVVRDALTDRGVTEALATHLAGLLLTRFACSKARPS